MKDGDEEIFKNYDQPAAAAERISLICTTFSKKKGSPWHSSRQKLKKKAIGVLYQE